MIRVIVAPFVGVWIEILITAPCRLLTQVAPFVGVWIEMLKAWENCSGI